MSGTTYVAPRPGAPGTGAPGAGTPGTGNTNEAPISPLAQIEAAVHERAKQLALDPSMPDANDRLTELVVEEVRRWNLEFKRGRREFELTDDARVIERILRNLLGYGPLESLLADDDVWEIMVNAPTEIFVKRHRGPSGYHHDVFHDDEHVRRTLTKILDEASGAHRTLNPAEGLQDAQLDNGARLHIVHEDISRGGHLIFNVRKFTGVSYRSLDELAQVGTISLQIAALLRAAVRSRLSILIAGSPGAGKTTLLSCCAAELDHSLRVVTAEEVFEVDIPLPNVASMQTRPARAERPAVDLRKLVAGFLRMAPDVAIVGEVRDREAIPLLLTLSSGVTGYATIHAGSVRQALTRLRFMCQLAQGSGEVPLSALNHLVSESIDLVVHLERNANGVQVSGILAVEEPAGGVDSVQFTATELFAPPQPAAQAEWTGQLPTRIAAKMVAAGYDLTALLNDAHSSDAYSSASAYSSGSRSQP